MWFFWINRWEIRVGGWNLQKCKLFYVVFLLWFLMIYGYVLWFCAHFWIFIDNLYGVLCIYCEFDLFMDIYVILFSFIFAYMIFCFLLCLLSSVYFFCFVLILHIWYFVPTVCVSEIVIVDITLCGLTCGYAYASGTCDINLRTPFGDE